MTRIHGEITVAIVATTTDMQETIAKFPSATMVEAISTTERAIKKHIKNTVRQKKDMQNTTSKENLEEIETIEM